MDVIETMRAAADPAQAAGMSAYMRDQFPFLGIPAPQRRRLCRSFLKAQKAVDWEFIFKCWELPEREFQYLAADCLVKLKARLSAEDVPHLRRLIITKSWWDTVDALDMIVGEIALRHPQVNETLLQWSVDENIWLRRAAIDHQLARREKTDAALLERILLNNLGSDEFFINKAIGWSLREYSKTDPGWVRDFMAGHKEKMAPLSMREGSKYL
ncbi:MAG: DNA alkylation repair protein [Clostridiales bacterium]|nr:DNA alkylation repair protein [Clostridiales bacterium]